MTRNFESRLAKLEKERAPQGRHFYVWKDSEAHREAEEKYQPGDVIHVIRWLDRESPPEPSLDAPHAPSDPIEDCKEVRATS